MKDWYVPWDGAGPKSSRWVHDCGAGGIGGEKELQAHLKICPGWKFEMSQKHPSIQIFEEALDVILAEARALLLRKQHDYGHGNILAFGEFGVLVRASDKLERLKNLYKDNRTPQNEGVEDSWVDLLNYAAIALMVRRGTFNLPLQGAP